MMKITFKIDDELGGDAIDIFNKIGIDMPTALRVFLKKVVAENGIPFDLKIDRNCCKKNIKEDEIIPAEFMDDIWDD